MDARSRWLAGSAALALMAAVTACTPAPKRIPGAYDTQDAALRGGANLSSSVARSLNDIPEARGASVLILGNVALVATDLRVGQSNYGPNQSAAVPQPQNASPQSAAGTPNTPPHSAGTSQPGYGGANAVPSRDRLNSPAARRGGGSSEGASFPGGTPNETGATPGALNEVKGNSGQPAGPPATNATGTTERYTRLAQRLQADYPQLREVRFVTNEQHARRLAAIADASRQGVAISPYMGELAAIFSDSVPAGVTKSRLLQRPAPGYGIPPGPFNAR